MFYLTKDDLQELNGSTLNIIVESDCIKIRLNDIVAKSNYKRLANLGRRFDQKSKTAIFPRIKDFRTVDISGEIYICPVDEENYGIKKSVWDSSIKWFYGDKNKVIDFCRKMQKGRIKKYKSISEIKENRGKIERAMNGDPMPANWKKLIKNPNREPDFMDIPVWDSRSKEWYDAEY